MSLLSVCQSTHCKILLYLNWKFLKNVFLLITMCRFAYRYVNLIRPFLKELLPFLTFHQKVCSCSSYILNMISSKLYYICRFAYHYDSFGHTILKESLFSLTWIISSKSLYTEILQHC